VRRAEDAAFARFAGASLVSLKEPDAVFRGYAGGPQLMGSPRADDPAPIQELRAALAPLAPDRLYIPFAVGGHVDHRQTRRAAMALLSKPGSAYLDRALFFEDFPYAQSVGFERLDQIDPEVATDLPARTILTPEYVEIGDVFDRKIEGLVSYASQIGHLFGNGDSLGGALRAFSTRVGQAGGVGPAERYWRVIPI
jgi:LmbE family N-acetylglucosaminyl deacetylase